MREIKFRAWDKDNEIMYYQGQTEENEIWTIDNEGIRFLEERTIDSFPGGQYHEQKEEWVAPNQILMQFTGLKDKNGKEIYEGDIIKLGCYTHIKYTQGFIGVIKWDNESAGFLLIIKNKDERIAHNTCAGMHNCIGNNYHEIIGNIYQNPELLN